MCKIFLFYISQKITIGNFIIQIVPVYINFNFFFFFFFLVKKKQISNICSVFFSPEFERERVFDCSYAIWSLFWNNQSKSIRSLHQESWLGLYNIVLRVTAIPIYIWPLKPHFYIEKQGFTGGYINFLISAQKHGLCVLVRTASPWRF